MCLEEGELKMRGSLVEAVAYSAAQSIGILCKLSPHSQTEDTVS